MTRAKTELSRTLQGNALWQVSFVAAFFVE